MEIKDLTPLCEIKGAWDKSASVEEMIEKLIACGYEVMTYKKNRVYYCSLSFTEQGKRANVTQGWQTLNGAVMCAYLWAEGAEKSDAEKIK